MTMLKETREKLERAMKDFAGKKFNEESLRKYDYEKHEFIYPSLSTLKRYKLVENVSGKDELTVEDLVELINSLEEDTYKIENGKIVRYWCHEDLYKFKQKNSGLKKTAIFFTQNFQNIHATVP